MLQCKVEQSQVTFVKVNDNIKLKVVKCPVGMCNKLAFILNDLNLNFLHLKFYFDSTYPVAIVFTLKDIDNLRAYEELEKKFRPVLDITNRN